MSFAKSSAASAHFSQRAERFRVEGQHPHIAGLQFPDLAVIRLRLGPLPEPQVDLAARLPDREALRLQLDGPRRLRECFVRLLQRQIRSGAVDPGVGIIRLKVP